MRIKSFLLGSIAIVAMLSFVPQAVADDVADLQAQLKSLQARIDNMETAKMDKVQKEEMAKMMKDILDDAKMQPAMPKWMENLTFYGDLRLRYQMDHHSGRPVGMVPGGSEGKYTNRARFRLRFGITKTWWDKQMEVGFRLASDQGNNYNGSLVGYQANSANVTFGQGFNKKYIGIDLAYAKYQPKWAKGLTFLAGKVLNPLRTKTDLTWEVDINPEGFAIDYVAPFFGDNFKPFAQVGYWIVGSDQLSVEGTRRDTTVWTFSTGFDWKINDDMAAFLGATWYQWENYPEAPGNGVSGSNLYGYWGTNTGSNMGMIELTSKFSWKMFNLPWQVWGTWVHNCKDTYNESHVSAAYYDRHFKGQNDAFSVGIVVGQNKKKGDWSANTSYYWVQGESVPWFTTDTTYGTPNAKGVKIGGKYNIDDFLTLGGQIYIYEPIEGGSWGSTPYGFAPGYNRDNTVTLQIEAVWKF